jgi:hypothetical protein
VPCSPSCCRARSARTTGRSGGPRAARRVDRVGCADRFPEGGSR